MDIEVDNLTYEAVVGSLSASEASVKVTGGKLPAGEHAWWHFDAPDTAGCFDESGEQHPAAEELICQLAAENVHRRLT